MTRRARLVFEPLTDWSALKGGVAPSPFSAKWPATRDLLLREADHLGALVVVLELALHRQDLRQDGEIRANARLGSGKVCVSMDTRHGPMRFACDRYDAGSLSWQANVRAIALTLEALRSVDRYGAVHTAEQYQGFLAIESNPNGFKSADDALRWVRMHAGVAGTDGSNPATAYRAAARQLHPDIGGDPAEFHRLQEAKELMRAGGLL